MPPVSADILCSSPPLARATSWATLSRTVNLASGVDLLIVARISEEVAEGSCEVAFNER